MPLNVQLANAQVKDPQSGQMTPAGLIGSDAISTINTAKNQAVAAVQQKGVETLESIPDDYTALTDEVDELKTQLNGFAEGKIQIFYDVIPNEYPSATGFPSLSGWDRSDYIPVTPGGTLYIMNPGARTNDNFWYNDEKEPTTKFSIPVGNPVEITVPEGTAYVVISNSHANFFDGVYTKVTAYATHNDILDLQAQLSVIDDRLENIDGIIVPEMEMGAIAFSSTSIVYQSVTTAIRTPITSNIRVNKGDVVKLKDYSNAKFKVAILKDSTQNYTYTNYRTTNYMVNDDGILYLVVAYSDDSTVTSVFDLSSLVEIEQKNGEIYDMSVQTSNIEVYNYILETEKFPDSLFGNGDINWQTGELRPTSRVYRVSTANPITLDFNIHLIVNTAFHIALFELINETWTRRNGDSAWLNSADITKGTKFAFSIARTTEDTSETANISEFVSAITVNTDLTNKIASEENIEVNADAISEFMARYYASNEAEAYAFFTDPHLMGSEGSFSKTVFNQYIGVLEETVKQTSTAYVVCGGDWLNNGDTKAQAAAKLGFVDGKMRAMFPEKYYPIVGNHDYNYLGVDGDGNRLPGADWISVDAMRNFWFHDHEHCYYKFKRMTAQNYVLNTRTDHDGNSAYDQGQLDWLAANLIEDDPAHSTIMFHIYYLSGVGTTIPTRVVAVGKIIAAFNAHTICTLTTETDGYEKTYDFTGTSGHIDYSLVGHTHADFSDTFGGVPVIGCDNFTDGGESTFDLIFADYSVGKVYCTRIGTGASREFNI